MTDRQNCQPQCQQSLERPLCTRKPHFHTWGKSAAPLFALYRSCDDRLSCSRRSLPRLTLASTKKRQRRFRFSSGIGDSCTRVRASGFPIPRSIAGHTSMMQSEPSHHSIAARYRFQVAPFQARPVPASTAARQMSGSAIMCSARAFVP